MKLGRVPGDKKHAFVPGDLVSWRFEGPNGESESVGFGIVIGSMGGTEEEVEEHVNKPELWYSVNVLWMADYRYVLDSHPVCGLVKIA